MLTLRLGSTGSDVQTWQTFLNSRGAALVVDGKFGQATDGATRTFQRAKKLAADGVVGQATWNAAGFAGPVTVGKNQTAPVDQAAYDVTVQASPAMPENQRRYALSVARGEGFYGLGWDLAGSGSNNWGAVQGVGDAGSFTHIDHHADGTPYTTAFKKYSTRALGFLDMARILLKPNVIAALDRGDLHGAVFAQHDNRYFELAPEKYFEAVQKNYSQLAANLDWLELGGGKDIPAAVVPLPAVKKKLATPDPSLQSPPSESSPTSSGAPCDSKAGVS